MIPFYLKDNLTDIHENENATTANFDFAQNAGRF